MTSHGASKHVPRNVSYARASGSQKDVLGLVSVNRRRPSLLLAMRHVIRRIMCLLSQPV
jgi:hypothetical protein